MPIKNGKLLREVFYNKFLEVITNSHMINTCFNISLSDNMFKHAY